MPCNNKNCKYHGYEIVVDTCSLFAILRVAKARVSQNYLSDASVALKEAQKYLSQICYCSRSEKLKISESVFHEEVDPQNGNSTFSANTELSRFYTRVNSDKSLLVDMLNNVLDVVPVPESDVEGLRTWLSSKTLAYSREYTKDRNDLSLLSLALRYVECVLLTHDLRLRRSSQLSSPLEEGLKVLCAAYVARNTVAISAVKFLEEPYRCCELSAEDYETFVINCRKFFMENHVRKPAYFEYMKEFNIVQKVIEEDWKQKLREIKCQPLSGKNI